MSSGFPVPTPGQAPESSDGGGGGGTTVHSELTGRDAIDQHPIESISGLQDALDNANYLTDAASVIDEFIGTPDDTKFLRADGTLAAPPGDGGGIPQDGTGTFTTVADGGNVVGGFADTGGTIEVTGANTTGAFAQGHAKESTIRAIGDGAVAQGFVSGYDEGVALLEAAAGGAFAGGGVYSLYDPGVTTKISAYDYGSLAFGYATKWQAGSGSAELLADARGAVAFGYVNVDNTGNGSTGSAKIEATGYGAHAVGFARTKRTSALAVGTGVALMSARSKGGFAQGIVMAADDDASIIAGGATAADGVGAFAQGYAKDGTLLASGHGSLAQGYAKNGTIESTGKGTVVHGYAGESSNVSGVLRSSGHASAAFGYSKGLIHAKEPGSLAFGYAYSYDDVATGTILADGFGSLAGGFAFGGATPALITTTGAGTIAFGTVQDDSAITASGGFAFGQVSQGANCTANGIGSLALGYSQTGDIIASGKSAAQIGPGTNAQDISISAGTGIRINGAIPGTPRNGDIWVDGGAIFGRSGDADVAFGGGGGGGGGLPQDGTGTFAVTGTGSSASGFSGMPHWGSDPLSYTVDSTVQSQGAGSFVHGHAGSGDGGVAKIESGQYNFGGVVLGYAYAYGEEATATVRAQSSGARAFGSASAGSPGDVALIAATRPGATALGFADGGKILAGVESGISGGQGALASGYAKDGGTILSGGAGAFAEGYALGGTIQATGKGASARGSISQYGGVASIEATTWGATAFGNVYAAVGAVEASISAIDQGSFAGGQVYAGSGITARVYASGFGSFAFGQAVDTTIEATAANSVQFGPGTNAQADSVSVGTGPRLKGTTGAPASPRNGDIWVDGSGNVIVQSGGVPVTIA